MSTREHIYRIISDAVRKRGWAPSYRDILAEVGLSQESVSTVHHHIKHLERDGRIVCDYTASGRRISRSIRPADAMEGR